MQKPKPEPDVSSACACGRSLTEATAAIYRSQVAEFVFHRCSCGVEWTERRDGIDRSQPVSTDEVIEVHQHLAAFDGPIAELFSTRSA